MVALRSFAIKRILHGLAMYFVMAVAYSLVFNGIAEKNLRALADEEVVSLMRGTGNLDSADYQKLFIETQSAKIRQYHLGEAWGFRVFWRALDILTFRFGNSTSLKSASGDRNVVAIVFEALPNTLFLFGAEAILVFVIGGYIGLRAARKPGSWLDRLASVLPMALNGFPPWWVGMLALMLFSYAIPLFPSGGVHVNPAPGGVAGILDYLWHMLLPLLTIVGLNVWNTAWLIRNLVADGYSKDFVSFARARGLSETKVANHVLSVLRPAIVTMVVLGLLQSLSGNILVEGIFNWPGLGSLYFSAVQQSDVPVLMAILALQTALNLTGLVILDLSYGWLDPRIRVGETK